MISLNARSVGVRLGIWDKIFVTCLIVAFVSHMSMTKTSLQLLTCTSIRPLSTTSALPQDGVAPALSSGCTLENANRRLAADMEVCCGDPASQIMMYGMGVPGVVVYAFGIPIAAAWMLWRVREELTTDPRIVATLGFLYNGYRDEAWFWESVVMLRKVGVAAVAVFLAPFGARYQTYTGLLLVFAVTVLQVAVRPFEREELNRLELAALVTAFVTFECGLFLTSDGQTGVIAAQVATIGIFAFNLGFLCMVIVTVGRAAMMQARMRWLQNDGT
jgi:hypothetical protein